MMKATFLVLNLLLWVIETSYGDVYIGPQDGLKEADKISSLPGQPEEVNFDQYSGYVTVDPLAGRALFYYFALSSHNPSTKPLVLWLNGGPGCSSLGNGALTELGPFRVNPDRKTLRHNKFAWNTVANILFLESPAGVGFSYSNRSSDYVTGDEKTAADSYTFLVNWLERFPEYKTRDFFLTGESYAGHYVPQLAHLILLNNKNSNRTVINLRGIAIGNADIDSEALYRGQFDYLWSHAIISDETHNGIVRNCNFTDPKPFAMEACFQYVKQAGLAKGVIYDYDLYAPLCSSSSNPSSHISGFDPCSLEYVPSYLNNAQVQKSLHANVTGIPGSWSSCNDEMLQKWTDQPITMLPTIKELMSTGIRVWLFSGDTDHDVPITSTRYAINKLGVSVKTPWSPWYSENQVGGYVVGYENVTFVTVRGSGHFVPSYQPARGLALFSSFIQGILPSQYPN